MSPFLQYAVGMLQEVAAAASFLALERIICFTTAAAVNGGISGSLA